MKSLTRVIQIPVAHIVVSLSLMCAGMLMLFPIHASASSVYFKKTDVTVMEGDTFPLTLNLDPASVPQYTAIVSLKFPADLVIADSFTFNSGWLAIPQPGYDLIDNVNGSIIKTAGYANGFSFPATLGTVMFKARHAGTGYITFEPSSQMLNENGDNTITSRGQFTVTVVARAPAKAAVKATTTPAVVPVEPTTTPTTTVPTLPAPILVAPPEPDVTNWMYNILAIILGLVLISATIGVLLGWVFFGAKRHRRNSRRSNLQ